MEVKIKKLDKNAVIPSYAKDGDAGMDLTAVSRTVDADGNVVYGFGLAFEIPHGYVGLIFPRSSNSKKDLALTNCVGVIDAGYRGEVMVKFRPSGEKGNFVMADGEKVALQSRYDAKIYKVGERVAQIIIMPFPSIEFVEVEELSKTERGEGGFGSSN